MASTSPLIFKRTKSKAVLRNRQTSPENNTEINVADAGEDSPSTLASKLKNKVKKSQSKSRLSFGGADDEGEDGEVFQVKKSNLSKKLSLGSHAASVPLNIDQATISPNRGPTYDQAYLQQLKASNPTSRPSLPGKADPYDADMSIDVGDVSMESLDIFGEDTSAVYIPSESSIKVAREKRERLRNTQASGEDDFISLSVTKRVEDTGPHPESRLVREEDEVGEGEDEYADYTSAQERIALGKKSRKLEASKKRDNMKEMIADAEEEDEETMEWEQEQLRRGGHRTPDAPSSSTKVKQVYRPASIPSATLVPTLPPVLARLSQQLTQLTASHAHNTATLNSLAQERGEVDDREMEMREMVGKAEDKRAWFSSFQEWVEGVAGFLDEKYPILEKLEEEHISYLRERLGLIAHRRRTDDEDDLSTFYGPLPIIPSAESEVEDTDELGRIISKPSTAVLRLERRAARQVRHQIRIERRKSRDEQGYSTDSSLPPHDASDYSSALSSLASRKKDVLADVRAEEFHNPSKGRWGAWREKYSDSYIGAWGGLGVVSVWEFWVRLEIVGWDCIEDTRGLDNFKWYKGLYAYCRPGSSDDGDELGPDGDLVASMITTVIIPRLCNLVEGGALDVYSERHVRRVVDLAEEVESSIEAGNVKFHTFLSSVVSIFQAAVSETESLLENFSVVGQSMAPFNPEGIPSRRRFLFRRVKLLKNILRWRKYTGERYGIGQLVGRLLENCFINVADGGWDVGGEEVAKTVAAMLPKELIPYKLKQRIGF